MHEINYNEIFPNFLLDKFISQSAPNLELNEQELDQKLVELQQKKVIMNKRSKDLQLTLYQNFLARTKDQKLKELEKLQGELKCLKEDELLVESIIQEMNSNRVTTGVSENESHVPDSSTHKRPVSLVLIRIQCAITHHQPTTIAFLFIVLELNQISMISNRCILAGD
jgi:hypothetical protein